MVFSTDPLDSLTMPCLSPLDDDYLCFPLEEDGLSLFQLPSPLLPNLKMEEATEPLDAAHSARQRFLMNLNSTETWEQRHPANWSPEDIVDWLFSVAKSRNIHYEQVEASNFNSLRGADLLSLTADQFCSLDSRYGRVYHEALQWHLAGLGGRWAEHHYELTDLTNAHTTHSAVSSLSCIATPQTCDTMPDLETLDFSSLSCLYDPVLSSCTAGEFQEPRPGPLHTPPPHVPDGNSRLTADSEDSDTEEQTHFHQLATGVTAPGPSISWGQSKRGRPSKQRRAARPGTKKAFRLWEFIRDLLKDPQYNPSHIRWESVEEGVFKFVKSEQVALLWGRRRSRDTGMTYEKLSRAMRYYYKSGIFQPVLGRRLVYRFGPNAIGWRPEETTVRCHQFPPPSANQ